MTQRAPFLILVAFMFALGLSAAAFRHYTYDIPWFPGSAAQIWQVEARIELTGTGGTSDIFLTLPPAQNKLELVNEAAASSGWGFVISEQAQQRRAHWSRRDVRGDQVLFYKLDFQVSDHRITERPPDTDPSPVLWDEPYATAASHILDAVRPISTGAHSFTAQLIRLLNSPDQNTNLLRNHYALPDLVTRLVRAGGHAARKVQGLELEDGRRRQSLKEFVQVWTGEHWQLYDPRRGALAESAELLLWQTEVPAVLDVTGGSRSRVTFSINSQTRSGLLLAQEQVGDLALSLYNLPIAEQGMFKLIMLLPFGALVVVLMRILIGIRTSGTFMPVLIALAFLQTELIPGLISFISVVAIGLVIRSYLSTLNLLLVARIATLVILVIAIISLFSIISYRLGLIQGLTITFFPMIILAWTIERMSIIWEEDGPREVLVQGSGSLLVAVLAHQLMSVEVVEHLAFNFPELHLVTLAIILLVGRYTGYRLLELWRFAQMAKAQ